LAAGGAGRHHHGDDAVGWLLGRSPPDQLRRPSPSASRRPSSCLGDGGPSSVLYGPIGSRQVSLAGDSVQSGPVRCSKAWWNVCRNDQLSNQRGSRAEDHSARQCSSGSPAFRTPVGCLLKLLASSGGGWLSPGRRRWGALRRCSSPSISTCSPAANRSSRLSNQTCLPKVTRAGNRSGGSKRRNSCSWALMASSAEELFGDDPLLERVVGVE
jgi:hypothetical protein